MKRVAEIWQEQGISVTPLYARPTPLPDAASPVSPSDGGAVVEPVTELFAKCDAWTAKEWLQRLVKAANRRDQAVRDRDDLSFATYNNIASSTASRIAREFADEIFAALSRPSVAEGAVAVAALLQPDGLSMSDGEIRLFYANLDEAAEAYDAIEALVSQPLPQAGAESELVEPVAWMHPIGAIWRQDNYPAGMDFTTGGWIPLVPAASIAQLQQRIAELDAECVTSMKTIAHERAAREAAERERDEAKAATVAIERGMVRKRKALAASEAKLAEVKREAVAVVDPFAAMFDAMAENGKPDDKEVYGYNDAILRRSDFRRARSFRASMERKNG